MKRRAFTLIEIMVAIVVTGLVVSLAYASISAGLDTRDSLNRWRQGSEREVMARAVLSIALRHALPGTMGGEAVFALTDRGDTSGRDELWFRTRGIEEPMGASDVWEVLVRGGPDGTRIAARPQHGSGSDGFVTTLPGVRGVDVLVRGRDDRDGWLAVWPVQDRSPVAVSVVFLGSDGRALGAPMVTRIGLEGNQ